MNMRWFRIGERQRRHVFRQLSLVRKRRSGHHVIPWVRYGGEIRNLLGQWHMLFCKSSFQRLRIAITSGAHPSRRQEPEEDVQPRMRIVNSRHEGEQ